MKPVLIALTAELLLFAAEPLLSAEPPSTAIKSSLATTEFASTIAANSKSFGLLIPGISVFIGFPVKLN